MADETDKAEEDLTTLVLLVRHGTTPTTGESLPGRAPGLHLAPKGIAQAEAAASRIAAIETKASNSEAKNNTSTKESARKIAAIYASPMERTLETAAPIANALKLETQKAQGLIECDFGEWTGRKLKELRKKPEWEQVVHHPSGFRFPKGESFLEMQCRATETINQLASQHRGETIVAVSHADVIKAITASAIGTHLDLFQRIIISPCSVTTIRFGAQVPLVLGVNSCGDDLTGVV